MSILNAHIAFVAASGDGKALKSLVKGLNKRYRPVADKKAANVQSTAQLPGIEIG